MDNYAYFKIGGRCKIKSTYIFPIVLIVLDVGAAIVNAYNRQWKMVVYWLAAAVLNAAVTF